MKNKCTYLLNYNFVFINLSSIKKYYYFNVYIKKIYI